jgi:hypothetical protein
MNGKTDSSRVILENFNVIISIFDETLRINKETVDLKNAIN